MNGYAGLALCIYLVLVLKNKRQPELVDMLSQETDFAKWAVSLGLIYMVSSKLGDFGNRFIAVLYVAMALVAIRKNPDVFDNLTNILKIGG